MCPTVCWAPAATRKCKLEVPGRNGVTYDSMNECEDVKMYSDQAIEECWDWQNSESHQKYHQGHHSSSSESSERPL